MATTDININSQNVVQTTAEWASDTTVYSDKYVLWVSDSFYSGTDQMQFKKADGTQTFANLDFMPLGGGGASVMAEYSHTNTSALADNSDYFISINTSLANTVNATVPEPIPAGKVVKALISTYNGSTFGSSEGVTLTLVYKDGNSLGLLSNNVKYDARNNFLEVVLDIDISTSQNTFIKIDSPTMITNPTATKTCVNLIIEL